MDTYSVYTRVGQSEPPVLVLLGDGYSSSSGPVKVAKKAMKQLMRTDSRIRKKHVYVRKHNSPHMRLYRASTKKITPKVVNINGTDVVYTMKPSATYLKTLKSYKIINV